MTESGGTDRDAAQRWQATALRLVDAMMAAAQQSTERRVRGMLLDAVEAAGGPSAPKRRSVGSDRDSLLARDAGLLGALRDAQDALEEAAINHREARGLGILTALQLVDIGLRRHQRAWRSDRPSWTLEEECEALEARVVAVSVVAREAVLELERVLAASGVPSDAHSSAPRALVVLRELVERSSAGGAGRWAP